MDTETRLQQLEQRIQELLTNPTKSATQQLTYPIDPVTRQILSELTPTTQAFPVNSIYVSVDSTNPATTLGYGTWTAFGSGRTLVGVDANQTEFDTVEETGGEKTHQLTIAEMPAHTHTKGALGVTTDNAGYNNGNQGVLSTGSTGGDGAHNNLQPYICVYFWKRTA